MSEYVEPEAELARILDGHLTVAEAARSLGLSAITVREAFRSGRLAGYRVTEGPWERIYVTRESVEHYRRHHLAPGQRGRYARPRKGNDD